MTCYIIVFETDKSSVKMFERIEDKVKMRLCEIQNRLLMQVS